MLGFLRKMGQTQSQTSEEAPAPPTPAWTPPPSPLTQTARIIANAIRIAPTRLWRSDVLPSPPPLSPSHVDTTEDGWNVIRRAEGFDNLTRAVEAFLGPWQAYILMEYVAQEHNEDQRDTQDRFALRYLDGRNFDGLSDAGRALLLARMLRDEVDLPGFRRDTAVRRWAEIETSARRTDVNDAAAVKTLSNALEAFISDHGFERLVESLEAPDRADEEWEDFHRFFGPCLNDDGPENIIYEPIESRPRVSQQIVDWLIGRRRHNALIGSQT